MKLQFSNCYLDFPKVTTSGSWGSPESMKHDTCKDEGNCGARQLYKYLSQDRGGKKKQSVCGQEITLALVRVRKEESVIVSRYFSPANSPGQTNTTGVSISMCQPHFFSRFDHSTQWVLSFKHPNYNYHVQDVSKTVSNVVYTLMSNNLGGKIIALQILNRIIDHQGTVYIEIFLEHPLD